MDKRLFLPGSEEKGQGGRLVGGADGHTKSSMLRWYGHQLEQGPRGLWKGI